MANPGKYGKYMLKWIWWCLVNKDKALVEYLYISIFLFVMSFFVFNSNVHCKDGVAIAVGLTQKF